jgi:hypothetical protein
MLVLFVIMVIFVAFDFLITLLPFLVPGVLLFFLNLLLALVVSLAVVPVCPDMKSLIQRGTREEPFGGHPPHARWTKNPKIDLLPHLLSYV